MENFYTTEEAAQFLRVTASRIRQLILEKRINSQKIGRDHFIPQSEIAQFSENGKKKRGRPSKK
jgi:site-specific DNA-methyltransferase (cytosine-N4-specific)